jgi:hypothetical protein
MSDKKGDRERKTLKTTFFAQFWDYFERREKMKEIRINLPQWFFSFFFQKIRSLL